MSHYPTKRGVRRRRKCKPRRRAKRKPCRRTTSEPRCECGNPTTRHGQPCRQCRELDSATPIESEVRHALRLEPMTCNEIAATFDGHYGSVLRVLKRMQKTGLVRVVGSQDDRQGEALVYGWCGLSRERRCA